MQPLEAVYDELLPVVYGFCRARLAVHDAEDVCADVFRAAAERLAAEPEVTLERSWFVAVARNRIIDRWRRSERWDGRLAVLAGGQHAAESAEVTHARVEDARVLLDHLPTAQRAAVVLHYLDGLPVSEVAAVLDRSPSAVESLLARARRTLVDHGGIAEEISA